MLKIGINEIDKYATVFEISVKVFFHVKAYEKYLLSLHGPFEG